VLKKLMIKKIGFIGGLDLPEKAKHSTRKK